MLPADAVDPVRLSLQHLMISQRLIQKKSLKRKRVGLRSNFETKVHRG